MDIKFLEAMRRVGNIALIFFLFLAFDTQAMGQKPVLDLQIQSVKIKPAVAGKKTLCRVLVRNGSSFAVNTVGVKISPGLNILNNQEFSCGLIQTGSSPVTLNQRVYTIVKPGQTVNVDFYLIFKKSGTFKISATIPDSISWDVNPENNTKQSPVNVTLPRPEICAISPRRARPGEWVEIRGNWFSTLPHMPVPIVNVGAYSAKVDSVSPAAFIVKIPCKKLTGAQSLSVTTFSGTSKNKKKVYVNSPKPTIKSIEPKTLLPGTQLKITVNGLIPKCQTSVMLSESILRVDRIKFLLTSGLDTTSEVFVTIPKQLRPGSHKLTVQTIGGQDMKPVNIK